MKNSTLDIDYSDLHWGKYDSPIAQYIDLQVMGNGDFGDEEESDGEGNGCALFGRRIQWWNDQGFVGCDTYATQDDASKVWAGVVDRFYAMCEKCGEKVHNDSDSWYEHEKYGCEPSRPPRMDHNANGSWFCNDCKKIVILFDDNEHDCEVTQTSSAIHANSEGLLDEFQQSERIIGTE